MSSVSHLTAKATISLPGRPPAGQAAAPAIQRQQAKAAKPLGVHPPLQASYQYDKILRQVVVVLSNPETGGVVLEVPSSEVRSMAAKLLQVSMKAFESDA